MCIGELRVSSATNEVSIPWSWRKGYSPAAARGFARVDVERLGNIGRRIVNAAIDFVQSFAHMRSMLTETFSNARNNLKAVIDRVVADHAPIKITRQRGENVVMVSESDWESMEETLYLLSSPKNAERLLRAIRGLEAGRGEVHELIEE